MRFYWLKGKKAPPTFIGLHGDCWLPQQELAAGDSGVEHHVPADVGLDNPPLVAAVYELQAQFEVLAYGDLQGREDQVHIGLRGPGVLALKAEPLRFFQNGPLLASA